MDLRDGIHGCEGDVGSFGLDPNNEDGEAKSENRPDENEDERLCLFSGRDLR